MHEILQSPVVPESSRACPEPISADECEWVLEAAARFGARWKAPHALAAHLEAIAGVLADGEPGSFDAAVLEDLVVLPADPAVPVAVVATDDVLSSVRAPEAFAGFADATCASDEAAPAESASCGPATPQPACLDALAAEAPAAPVVADLGSIPGAAPLFPRGASSQQRRKGARSRSRANRPAGESPDEASLQMALPLESDGRARVAVSHFAERMLRARERLATDEPTTSMGASGEVLSFAERLKKVRERLSGEDGDAGCASA
jgi:hypothetical protein